MNPEQPADQPPAQPADTNFQQPVAYDANGQPLYAHPPTTPPPAPNQPVHISRPLDPVKPVISPETQAKHDESKRRYPWLNLSDGEYVISAVRRHPIGLIIPLAIGALLIVLASILLLNYADFAAYFNFRGLAADPGAVTVPGMFFILLVALGMAAVFYVYVSNKFFLTNESVIQEIQLTLFSKLEQTVSLSNIEDASYTQHGVLQYLFNYGSIRLSTEGDETTYRFTYVANPRIHIATLNNAVEAFKNGHPTDPDET